MLGLNPKDALGLAEDMQLVRNARGSVSPSATSDLYRAAGALADASRGIKERNDSMRKLKANFDGLAEDYSDLSAVALASRRVIDALADELAKVKGLNPADVRRRAYAALSRSYDEGIGEMVSTGAISKDPRKDPAVLARPSRDWYTPEA